MANLVVVEDDTELCDGIVSYLQLSGHNTTGFADGPSLYRHMVNESVDLVVLDIVLDGEDGLSIARHLRQNSTAGIVIVTGQGELNDRIEGMRSGVDAYLVKPVDMRELIAVVESVLRRISSDSPTALPEVNLPEGCWVFDSARWRITTPGSEIIELTSHEYHFLSRLIEEPTIPVSRDDLVLAIGKKPEIYDHRSLDALIRRLRRKVEKYSELKLPVRAAHAKGYVFAAPVVVR